MDTYTVLMVDDEPLILSSMRRLFRNERFELLTANSGQEALEIVAARPVQVVVTDNIMPNMTGVELIKRIRDIAPNTIRMIISGQSQLDSVLEAVNEGEAFRFILKPWNDIDLKATINIALAHYQLRESHDRLIEELRRKGEILDRIAEQYPDILASVTRDYISGQSSERHSITNEIGGTHGTRSR